MGFQERNLYSAREVAQMQPVAGLDVYQRIREVNKWGEGRVDTLQMYSEKTRRKMRDSGLRMVFMGAESGSDETLKRMHKGGK